MSNLYKEIHYKVGLDYVKVESIHTKIPDWGIENIEKLGPYFGKCKNK